MDSEYDRKFVEMKQYIPFLENMIKRLETNPSSANPRQAQLDKIKSLRNLLLDKKKRMKMENLLKCEQVLLNLYTKVEQKDTLPGIKKASDPIFPPDSAKDSHDKSDLNSVRRKLKSVVSIEDRNEVADTLPEIARANETEVVCTPGSKEPALFQRRPHKTSISPPAKVPLQTEKKSPQKPVQKRNYTRVLVSPDRSRRRWSTAEEPSDKPLFSRRSPRRLSPSYHKKERKKSSVETKQSKHKDLNITLNVPEESLNSLNTEDIFSRIINCSDSDVDIDTLRNLRKQILGELKHTGAKEDISDLILKSYKKRKSKNKSKKRVEVEEGEISDSESEAIKSIYGSLVLVDKDKGTSSEVEISTENEEQPRKIQICFVINSDKETSNIDKDITKEDNQLNETVTDISELQMFDNNEKTKSIEVKEVSEKEVKRKTEIKNQLQSQLNVSNVATPEHTIEKAEIENQPQQVNVAKQGHTIEKPSQLQLNPIQIEEVITIDDDYDVQPTQMKESEKPVKNNNKEDASNNIYKIGAILQKSDKTSHLSTNIIPFKANFYKPLNEKDSEESNEVQSETKSTEFQIETNEPQVKTQNSVTNNENPSLSDEKNIAEVTELTEISMEVESRTTKSTDDNIEIPLLNLDPIVPDPPAKQTVSEIDILQALKNEILSDNIPIPGTEGVTPALHQPKITKVASAREIVRKKRISIEKYKEKSVTSSKPSWFKDTDIDIYMSNEEQSKKQSIKLTEKERERFNFAPDLALGDSSDEDINKEYCLDDIYGDLAPESPEIDESVRSESTPPIIIPVDPVKTTMVNSKSDVDMRKLMPLLSPTAHRTVASPGSTKLVSSTINDTLFESVRIDNKHDQNYRPPTLDPRLKWELNKPFEKDSPNPRVINPERTPRPAVNYPNMTPNMTPSRTPCLTPNARTFEMTPSHVPFDLEDNSIKKHVYAPSFPIYEHRDRRELSVIKDSPRPNWEPNEEMTRESRSRWENSEARDRNYPRKWESGRDLKSTSMHRDNPSDFQRFRNNESLDKYQNDMYGSDRRDDYSYSRLDCPRTPIHSFGRSDYPATPTSSFGRMETPMTPVHPFGRSECPTTPSHPFGRSDCPATPSHTFGRSECPPTPSHPFGRSECPSTPNHPFGRSECPSTPSHPFGKLDMNVVSLTPTHPFGRSEYSAHKFVKDPRLNRSTENKSSSLNYDDDRDRGYCNDKRTSDVLNRRYNTSDSYRSYGREQSIVGTNDRPYERSYNIEHISRRESSVGRPITKEYDNQHYSRERDRHNNDYQYDAVRSNYIEVGSRRNYQRASSVGRTIDHLSPSSYQTPSDVRNDRNQANDKTLSVKPQSGRSFTIDTSVNRTFQEFLNNKGMQSIDYTFDTRRQRSSSVGRSLVYEPSVARTNRESSVGRTLSKPRQPEQLQDNSKFNNRNNFVRARSMGREMVQNKQEKSFKDIKADFRLYSANFKMKEPNKTAKVKTFNYVDPRTRRENREKQQHPIITKQVYSPKKNIRDPRLRREQQNDKNKYGAEVKSRDRRNYGIVYSNDNITKGTILGSGYGVKNYKIPKIKRVIEEKDKVINQKETESIDELLNDEKKKIITENKGDINTSSFQKYKQNKDGKLNQLHKTRDQEKKPTLHNVPKIETRSNTKDGKVVAKLSDKGAAAKHKKNKKVIISDSDSDSQEKKEAHDYKVSSKETKNNSSITVQVDEIDKNEDDLCNLGIGDLDLFSDNLASDPVLDNINALIAGLDNDIDDSKDNTSKQFTKEISLTNMLESITSRPSPTDALKQSTVEESLNDLNELINEDLNKSVPESQDKSQKLHSKKSANQSDANKPQDQMLQTLEENVYIKSNNLNEAATKSPNLKNNESQAVNNTTAVNNSKETMKESIDIERNESENISDKPDLDQKESADNMLLVQESIFQSNIQNKVIKNSGNVDRDSIESIVSTTDIPKEPFNPVEGKLVEKTDECYPDRSSTPHNTNEVVQIKACDKELPDSTSDMQIKMFTDISSSHESTQISNKETEHSSSKGSASQIDTIGSLLSMLQDKSKIKELLSMLDDQSAGSEKIKKKLERLSEIVSDDEETNTVEQNEVTVVSDVASSEMIEESKSKEFLKGTEVNKIEESECEGALETIQETKHADGAPKIIDKSRHEGEKATKICEESKCKELSSEKNRDIEIKEVVVTLKESEHKLRSEINENENKDKIASKSNLTSKIKTSEIIEDNKTIEKDANDQAEPISQAVEILENIATTKVNKDSSKDFDKTYENVLSNKNDSDGTAKENIMYGDNSAVLIETEVNAELNDDLKKRVTDDTDCESDSELSSITKPQTSRRGKKMIKRTNAGKFKKGVFGKERRVTRSAILQPKPKKTSRELKQLQDDIKEMFLSDEILNTTGIRMCRLAKLVDEKSSYHEEECTTELDKPVVALEKFKKKNRYDEVSASGKTKKKLGIKQTGKAPKSDSSIGLENKVQKNKIPKYKSGPKSKTSFCSESYELSEIDYDPISEKKLSDALVTSSDSENESLASSRSCGSSDVLIEMKKKPKRKRRGAAWQSGVIKPKKKKKAEPKPIDSSLDDNILVPQKRVVPDKNCYTDKTYCFLKNVSTYACRLCDYSGNEIVNHFKRRHPHSEIPLSRMSSVVAQEAIEQCEDINFMTFSKIGTDKYVCRFCYKEFTDRRKSNTLEVFFWHVVSTHTGEYKQLCSECINMTRCPFNLDIPPPPKAVKGQLIGFICGKCNYTQISLENLKTHVIVRHNDEKTVVCAINLAVMTKKTMSALMKQSAIENPPRLLRSSRSTQSVTEASDDRSSDITETTDRLSELDSMKRRSIKNLDSSSTEWRKGNISQAKLSFENEDSTVKIEENSMIRDIPQFDDLCNSETSICGDDQVLDTTEVVRRTASDDIVDYPHFKISYTEAGAKEYVCCINGKDNHYKTSLFISMKKHVQTKHPESWDGYCFKCKVIVTTQGKHNFKECFQHLLDMHIDNLPILERIVEPKEKTGDIPVEKTPVAEVSVVENTPSTKSYINVRPLAELLSKESENLPAEQNSKTLPIIENVTSLDTATVEPPLPSPTHSITETASPQDNTAQVSKFTQMRTKTSTPEQIFKYEEAQAEVMKQKHQVVLESMMSHDKLIKIFKCAGRYCYFTSDSLEAALLHASTHQRIGGENALLCSYCDFDCSGNAIVLVTHVFKIHGRCPFVCAYCFYRGAASQLVRAHMIRVHGQQYDKDAVLKTDTVTPGVDDPGDMLSREDVVQNYNCADAEGSCKFRTYTHGKFCDHLTKHNPPHVCYFCLASQPTPLDLVNHMKSHNLKMYQCTWCYEGADTEPELLDHASVRHPCKQPQAYLRVITMKEGTSKMMVLPLAQYNKSMIPTELVPSSTSAENPVREAERSIELEKLIGSMIETSTPIPVDVDNLQEPSMLNEMESVEKPRLITPPPSTSAPEEDLSSKTTPVLKVEYSDDPPKNHRLLEDIICLDSDDDSSDLRPNVIDLSNEEAPTPDKSCPKLRDQLRITEEIPSTLKDVFSAPKDVISTADDELSTPKDVLPPPKDVLPTPNEALSAPKDPLAFDPKFQKISAESLYKCPKCTYICKTLHGFKRHRCFLSNDDAIDVVCCHCQLKLTSKMEFYNHLENDHKSTDAKEIKDTTKDSKDVFCGICDFRHRSLSLVKNHIRTEHGITNLVVTKYGDNGDSQCTVRESPKPKATSKRKLSTGNTDMPAKRKRFGPQDVDLLPTKPILDELAYCSVCEFSSKVRLNLVRHLQGHADKQPVAQTVPVNPVPHLETNEKHFDKMVNLASSSIVTRGPDKPTRVENAPAVSMMIPPEAASRYPKYVADRQRLTCGAKGCSYISVDEAMLKCHWETLHAGTNEYHCVHCPPYQHLDTSKPLTASRIIAHLKMHDIRLYACSSCSYYHYKKQVVEKHLNEIHKGAGLVATVREESSVPPPGVTQPTTAAPTMDLKPWQCGLCKFKNMLRQEVVEHCAKIHSSKMQFKCPNCPFRTSTIENVTKHCSNSHPTSKDDVIYYYYREGSIADEYDGTPRWMYQRQKMGIVDPEVKTEVDAPNTPNTPAACTSAVDLNLVKQETEDSDVVESIEDLCKRFGQFCDPNGLKFKCSLCKAVMEDSRDAMQSHLFEELKYRKWSCSICSYKAFHKTGLKDHMLTEHRQNRDPVQLPVNTNVEKWVSELLSYQSALIEKARENFAKQKIQTEKPRPNTLPTEVKKPSETAPEPKVEELQEAFGPLGASTGTDFCCPKCDFKVKDVVTMRNHLETELNRIRWRCSKCAAKFQEYHEAQLHCKSIHPGQAARPVEALRDPGKRAAWVAAVLRTQKLTMHIEQPQNAEPIVENCNTPSLENSLLVVRYEKRVPTPEEEMLLRRKKPPQTATTTPDSDEERLVIDETTEDKTPNQKSESKSNCPYCDFTSKYNSALRDHILRHYNVKPYSCGYCDYTCYVYQCGKHNELEHPDLPNKFTKTKMPDEPPITLVLTKRGKRAVHADDDSKPKDDAPKKDDGPKVICLICQRTVPEAERKAHVHERVRAQFGKKGGIVVKCCTCLALFEDVHFMELHHKESHPNTNINYAYHKLQSETREDIHNCGHCSKRFKYLRDLRSHHNAVHRSLKLKYTMNTFVPTNNDKIDCDDDASTSKRKLEDANPLPSLKRVAKKSTTKLPNQCVAKKSTTKLPYNVDSDSDEEYSYYGTKPTSLDEYPNVSTLMPFCNTMMPFSVKKLSELIKISPRVIVEDLKN